MSCRLGVGGVGRGRKKDGSGGSRGGSIDAYMPIYAARVWWWVETCLPVSLSFILQHIPPPIVEQRFYTIHPIMRQWRRIHKKTGIKQQQQQQQHIRQHVRGTHDHTNGGGRQAGNE